MRLITLHSHKTLKFTTNLLHNSKKSYDEKCTMHIVFTKPYIMLVIRHQIKVMSYSGQILHVVFNWINLRTIKH